MPGAAGIHGGSEGVGSLFLSGRRHQGPEKMQNGDVNIGIGHGTAITEVHRPTPSIRYETRKGVVYCIIVLYEARGLHIKYLRESYREVCRPPSSLLSFLTYCKTLRTFPIIVFSENKLMYTATYSERVRSSASIGTVRFRWLVLPTTLITPPLP